MAETNNAGVEFFAAASKLTFEGWALQTTGGNQQTRERYAELGADGDEIASALTGYRREESPEFVYRGETGAKYAFPSVGSASGGYHVDAFTVRWSRDALLAKMSVRAHSHGTGKAHSAARTYTPSLSGKVTAPAVGVPSGLSAVTLGATSAVDFREAEYTVECSHVDEKARDGNFLDGNNHDGRETLTVTFTGVPADADLTVAEGWQQTSRTDAPSNTGATVVTITWERHLKHD